MTSQQITLPILHAGSLGKVGKAVNELFKELHPEVNIEAQPAGSADAVRKITRGEANCGIIASADYQLIEKLMFPDFADWYLIFAANQMVLRYTDKTPYHEQVNSQNWYQIFLRDGVNFWRFDADGDPGGYRALMVMQLAEKHYGKPGLYKTLMESPNNRLLTKDTFPQMASGYSFGYGLSTGGPFKTLALPDEINLSNNILKDFYRQANVKISGNQSKDIVVLQGSPIYFGLTVPKGFKNKDVAIAWINLLFSQRGRNILEQSSMAPVKPIITNNVAKVPEALRKYLS
jgi:molybdate/tungstate transport system substrate-binding protein